MQEAIWFFLAALLLTNTIDLASAGQLRPLINDLKAGDTQTVLKAIKGLGESGDIRAVLPLLDALRDEHGVVRQYTVEALRYLVRALDDVHIVTKRGLQSLIDKLRLDPSDDVITIEQPDARSLGKAVLGGNMWSKACT
jgi:HEAT repeat protein